MSLSSKDTLLPVSLSCHLASIHQRALILFIQTLVLYKSFTYLLTYLTSLHEWPTLAAVSDRLKTTKKPTFSGSTDWTILFHHRRTFQSRLLVVTHNINHLRCCGRTEKKPRNTMPSAADQLERPRGDRFPPGDVATAWRLRYLDVGYSLQSGLGECLWQMRLRYLAYTM